MRRPGANAPSDVNGRKKAIDNLGRTVAAGFATRCVKVTHVLQRPHVWESAPSTSESSASVLQGSGTGVCVLRVVPGTSATRKGATSVSSSKETPLTGDEGPCLAPSGHG